MRTGKGFADRIKRLWIVQVAGEYPAVAAPRPAHGAVAAAVLGRVESRPHAPDLRRPGVGCGRDLCLGVGLGRPATTVGQAAQAYASARHLLHHEGSITLRATLGERAIPRQSHLVWE